MEVSAEDFVKVGRCRHRSLGWNRHSGSTWFEVSQARRGPVRFFMGVEWGHGVGLCQKGGRQRWRGVKGRPASLILERVGFSRRAQAVDETSGIAAGKQL